MWFDLQRCDPDQVGPHTLTFQAVIPATPDVVFQVLASEETWPRWFPDLTAMRWLTAEPHGVGSLRRADLRGGFSVIEHFLVYEPGERLAFFVERATIPLVSHLMEDYQLTPVAGGATRLDWRVHYRVHRPLRLLHPVALPLFQRLFATGIRNLAAFVASEQAREARTG